MNSSISISKQLVTVAIAIVLLLPRIGLASNEIYTINLPVRSGYQPRGLFAGEDGTLKVMMESNSAILNKDRRFIVYDIDYHHRVVNASEESVSDVDFLGTDSQGRIVWGDREELIQDWPWSTLVKATDWPNGPVADKGFWLFRKYSSVWINPVGSSYVVGDEIQSDSLGVVDGSVLSANFREGGVLFREIVSKSNTKRKLPRFARWNLDGEVEIRASRYFSKLFEAGSDKLVVFGLIANGVVDEQSRPLFSVFEGNGRNQRFNVLVGFARSASESIDPLGVIVVHGLHQDAYEGYSRIMACYLESEDAMCFLDGWRIVVLKL